VNVLFVDDDSLVREAMRRTLSFHRDIEFVTVGSGPTAIAKMESRRIDVLISDLQMPGMDGATLLDIARKRWPATIRIVFAADIGHDVAMRLLSTAHQYLMKPCIGDELIGVLRRIEDLFLMRIDASVQDLIGGVSSLPSLPETYRELSDALRERDTPPARLARIIERNPAVALKLVQVANSAFFSRRQETRDVRGAVVHLGTETIRHIVLQLAVYQLMEHGPTGLLEYFRQLQARSLRVADCASQLVSPELQGTGFLAGLLCDVGQLVLGTSQREAWASLVAESKTQKRPLQELEMERWGVTHADVGALLMGVWGLPLTVIESAAYHHDLEVIGRKDTEVPVAVCLANLLIDSLPVPEELLDGTRFRDRVRKYESSPGASSYLRAERPTTERPLIRKN